MCIGWCVRGACRGQYISFAEATAILKNELKFPEERAIHFVKRFDHNKDGRLSAGEFSQFKKRIEDTCVTSDILTQLSASPLCLQGRVSVAMASEFQRTPVWSSLFIHRVKGKVCHTPTGV